MTAGHLLLAAAMSGYILIAIRHEERDLVRLFGDRYESYRRRGRHARAAAAAGAVAATVT